MFGLCVSGLRVWSSRPLGLGVGGVWDVWALCFRSSGLGFKALALR